MPCDVFKSVSVSCDSLCWATMVSGHMDSLKNDQLEIFPMCWVSVATIVNSFYCRCNVSNMPGDTQRTACS